MQIFSPVFTHQSAIPSRYTCDGDDVSPPLEVAGVPSGTRSLALIMDDPDAPMGTWVHWTLWNIPSDTRTISQRSVPRGSVEGLTSFGTTGWGGPCPPSGTHRYFFKLYALDTVLALNSSTDKAALEKAMEGHILVQAELMGVYQRSK